MKKETCLIAILTLLIVAAMAAPVFAQHPTDYVTPTPTPTDDEALGTGVNPQRPVLPVPEYPLLGGAIAIIACFAALAVFKLRKTR